MNIPQYVITTSDECRFGARAAAMVFELATPAGASPGIAIGRAVHDQLTALRRAAAQGDIDA